MCNGSPIGPTGTMWAASLHNPDTRSFLGQRGGREYQWIAILAKGYANFLCAAVFPYPYANTRHLVIFLYSVKKTLTETVEIVNTKKFFNHLIK